MGNYLIKLYKWAQLTNTQPASPTTTVLTKRSTTFKTIRQISRITLPTKTISRKSVAIELEDLPTPLTESKTPATNASEPHASKSSVSLAMMVASSEAFQLLEDMVVVSSSRISALDGTATKCTSSKTSLLIHSLKASTT